MKRCWSAEVNQRPKFAEILRGMNEMLMKYYGDTASLTPEEVAEPSVRKESKVEFLLRVTGNCLMHNMSADMNACIERSRDRDGETAASPYDPWLIDESALRIVDRLGEGRYGEVNKVSQSLLSFTRFTPSEYQCFTYWSEFFISESFSFFTLRKSLAVSSKRSRFRAT